MTWEGMFSDLGVVMVRRLFAGLALGLVMVPFIAIPTALAPGAGAAPPASIQQCMNDGWQTLTSETGQPFPNQGLCIAFVIHHPVSLDDLAGSITNGSFSAVAGCGFLEGTFLATYPGSGAVGTVTLQMDGCFPSPIFPPAPLPFSGTFGVTTNVGTLNGTVAGQLTNVALPTGIWPASATFVLTVTSGTDLFTGTTGTLNVSLQWPELGTLSPFVGTIAPA